MSTGDDAEPAAGPAALASVVQLRRSAEADLEAGLWQLSDAQALEGLADSFAALQQAHAAYLRRVADLDARPGAVAGARPGAVAKTFLIHKLQRNPWDAGLDVRAAKALSAGADPATGGMPRLGAALARGEVSREHANVAVKAMTRLPAHLLREPADDGEASLCRGHFVDALLTGQSRRHPPGTVDRLAQYLQHAADPGGARSFDPDAVVRRGVSVFADQAGMTVIRGELDQANGALVRAALDAFGRPDPVQIETADDGSDRDHRRPVRAATRG